MIAISTGKEKLEVDRLIFHYKDPDLLETEETSDICGEYVLSSELTSTSTAVGSNIFNLDPSLNGRPLIHAYTLNLF